jgi:hypothetical protein
VRTTLTLDPDVARLLDEEAHRARKSFKEVVNAALRRGLSPAVASAKAKPYRVRPHAARLAPGFDRGRFNALTDELEDNASNDSDFARFAGLSWENPLVED